MHTNIDEELLKIICCPEDKNELQRNEDSLYCKVCNQTYAINENVPILLTKEITSENKEDNFSKTKKNHDKIPTGFQVEQIRSKSKFKKFWNLYKFIKIQKNLPKEGKILDIGCGSGAFSTLKDTLHISNSKIIGLDISPKQVIHAKKRFPKESYVAGSGHKLPFKDNSFDSVILIEFIEHIPCDAIEKLLEEAKRVLKKDGNLSITTPNYLSIYIILEWVYSKVGPVNYSEQHITHFTPKKLKKTLKKINFSKVKIQTCYGISPFLSIISEKIAKKALKIEEIIPNPFRLKLICSAKK